LEFPKFPKIPKFPKFLKCQMTYGGELFLAEPFPRVAAQILERLPMSFLASQTLLRPVAAGEFLGVSAHTLAKKRMTRDGPRFIKFGGAVRYDLKDLQDFVARSVRRSTSDQGG
jgi:hypothetical protein